MEKDSEININIIIVKNGNNEILHIDLNLSEPQDNKEISGKDKDKIDNNYKNISSEQFLKNMCV